MCPSICLERIHTRLSRTRGFKGTACLRTSHWLVPVLSALRLCVCVTCLCVCVCVSCVCVWLCRASALQVATRHSGAQSTSSMLYIAWWCKPQPCVCICMCICVCGPRACVIMCVHMCACVSHRWVKGALEEAPDNRPPAAGAPATAASLLLAAAPTAASLTPTSNLSCLEDARSRLALNTQRHCDGQSASHVLLAGPSGSGKTWLLWDSTISAGV